MKIRKEQLDALNRKQAADYELRVTRFLRQQFADATQEPEEQLRLQVAAQIVKARGYGLVTEQEVASYVVSAWLLGQHFDTEFPAAQEVLTAPISGNMKACFLEEWTRELFQRLEGNK